MLKIGFFVGIIIGKIEEVAEKIKEEFGGDDVVIIYDIFEVSFEDFDGY